MKPLQTIIRSCLLGMAGAIAWIPSLATAHSMKHEYPRDISEQDRLGDSFYGANMPDNDVGARVSVSLVFTTRPPKVIADEGGFAKHRNVVTFTLNAALARYPYVDSGAESWGLAYVKIARSTESGDRSFLLPQEILEQIEHPDLSQIDASIYAYEYSVTRGRFVFSIPYAGEKWRAACIRANQGTHNNPYKKMIITLHEDGKFEYEIETPTLCDDALLGTGKFADDE